jgi:hypothetical protein
MTKLRQRKIDDLRLPKYSKHTIRSVYRSRGGLRPVIQQVP